MTATVFTVGRDCQGVLIAPNGNRMDLTNETTIEITPEYKTARCDPLNSPPAERFLPAGHRIMITLDRRNSQNDVIFTSIEQNWWAIGSADNGTGSQGMFTLFTTEVGGGLTVEQYSGLAMKLGKKGTITQDSPIKQTIECFASQKVQ
jgi:hypothetical protein